ncbi:hypothetical protein UFOVP1204_60 [uncultured Caudovirales phage]|uniref:Uncharacterized protein n=1 Tax=uncultured Caudovirales phage TaxID=2100421 RepID=A0A6J5Q4Z9_9CAUD|nr:hypothetical protein UFOVP473_41 [uncultured Caudovirales phage]CAB4176628.1 hypothetical protein UFOVP983_41 [uncultured Caudovirales phage]CAB4190313.1 hypothetical protein UFOVP1204_60 [uncultured Caudovirales phage]
MSASKKTPERIELLRKHAPECGVRELSRIVGVCPSSVFNWCRDEGIQPISQADARRKAIRSDSYRAKMSAMRKEWWKNPEYREAKRESVRRQWADPEMRAKMLTKRKPKQYKPRETRLVVIPQWVPDAFHEDYRRIAKTYGEEKAASHCRALKREMMAVEP